MAYYFMIETKKGEYQKIDISKSKYFQTKKRKFNKHCAFSLQEIDLFTMMFNNEIELRELLVQEGTLPLKYFDKPLSIRNLSKGKYTKVPYGLLHQRDIEYIMDPEKLIKFILEKYYQDDFLLIKKIANTFCEFRKCSSTAPEVRQFIEISIRENKRCPHLDSVDENGDKLVARLLKLIILDSWENFKTGKITYKDEVNYRNIHLLIALINNYYKENNKNNNLIQKAPEHIPIQEDNSSIEATKSKEKPKYVRTRKKYELKGQISFDI